MAYTDSTNYASFLKSSYGFSNCLHWTLLFKKFYVHNFLFLHLPLI